MRLSLIVIVNFGNRTTHDGDPPSALKIDSIRHFILPFSRPVAASDGRRANGQWRHETLRIFHINFGAK